MGFAGILDLINGTGEVRPQQISPTFDRQQLLSIDRGAISQSVDRHAGTYSNILVAAAAGYAVGKLARWIHGLHTVEYGGPLVRWLLMVLALGGCATLLTGNWVWLERRAAQRFNLGNRLLAKLTAGVGVGVFAALAALLLASRVIPLDWPRRILGEELAMAGTFAGWVLLAFCTSDTAALWWRGLGFAGALMSAVPIAAARHSPLGLFGSGPAVSAVRTVDAVLLGAGVVMLLVAFFLRRHTLSRRARTAGAYASAQALADLAVYADGAQSGGLDA